MKFLSTPEALHAKYEAESGQAKNIGNLQNFDRWINKVANQKRN